MITDAVDAALAQGAQSGRYDRSQRPDPVPCGDCKIALLEWEWLGHHRLEMWVAPAEHECGLVLCPACEAERELQKTAHETWRRLQRAGVPTVFRPYTWDACNFQPARDPSNLSDPWAHWAGWVLSQRDIIGVSRANRSAAEAMRSWAPGSTWLMLQGVPGSGKSLWSSALTRRLLEEPLQWQQQTLDDVRATRGGREAAYYERHPHMLPMRKTGGWSVLWVQEAELQSESRRFYGRSRRGSDEQDPMERAEEAQVLVLDDIGTAAASEAWDDAVARLLNKRYETGASTVITTNLSMSQIEERYGLRTRDRLEERLDGQVYELERRSWRRLRRGAA